MSFSSQIYISRWALFKAFFKMGVSGFGGVLPWARLVLVDEKRWLTDREFAERLGLSQVLPGPNIINLAVGFGAQHHGAVGALLAAGGLLSAPLVIVLSLATAYQHLGHHVLVGRALDGVAAAAAGMMLAAGIKLLLALPRQGWRWGVCGVALLGLVAWHWPLWALVLCLGPVGIWLDRRTDLTTRN
ncbi:chromate transporter [Chitinivorax tropicus]|uniref:Chromate transporter n=1 Tax=Chitinivorax tropicus TaxID=714531 RepID=A0A840MKZ8_9PROT|nr:chromate transporter [Chitinivorax tropicus]MBB5019090.1 chromate transporter [Chitinivorax tropicus]